MLVVDKGSLVVVVLEDKVMLVMMGWCIDVLEKCLGIKFMYCMMWYLMLME